jgi:hypothetical protein
MQDLIMAQTEVGSGQTAEMSRRSFSDHKKRSKIEKGKRLFDIRSRRELRRRLKKKKHPHKQRLRLYPKRRDYFLSIPAPKNFSFINNTEEVLGYFKVAARVISAREQVQLDMGNIEVLTPDAVALLIAKVKDKNFTRGLALQGVNPSEKDAKRLFEDSGFLDHVRSSYKPPRNESNLLFHQITNKKVDPELARKVAKLAVNHALKKDVKFQPIYKIMIECMANTDNHASPRREGEYDWWLFTYCDPDRAVASFTFLDLGVGIFNSNPVNTYKNQLLTKIEKATNLSIRDNIGLVPKLFSGEFNISKTGDKKRGQGLPDIKKLSANSNIKNFTIITNNLKIKLPSLAIETLKNKFNGTMLYWELYS